MNIKVLTVFKYTQYIVCIFFILPNLFSQQLSFKQYTVNDGLPSSTIYSAMQDRNGYMWFGTSMGVSRYDGYEFKNYTIGEGLSDNEVFNVFEDSRSRIWFLTLNGKVSYYYQGKIYNAESDSTLAVVDSDSYISGIAEDTINNRIWFSTFKGGLVSYSADKGGKRYFTGNEFQPISDIMLADDGVSLYVFGNGVHKIEFIANDDSVKNIIPVTNLMTVFMAARYAGQDILISNYKSIGLLNKSTNIIRPILKNSRPAINNLCIQDSSIVWICTKQGFMSFTIQTESFGNLILTDYNISGVLKDREGNRWVTTLGNGIFFRSVNPIYQYTMKDGLLSNSILTLTKDEHNKVWVGYNKGAISYVDHGKVISKVISTREAYDNTMINRIVFSNGKTWIVTTFGLFLLGNGYGEFLPIYARDLLEFPNNHLWIASSSGIVECDDTYFEKHKIKTEVMNDHSYAKKPNYIMHQRSRRLFLDGKSNIWMSTENGLLIKDKDSKSSITSDCLKKLTFVNDFAEISDGTIFLATNREGLVVVRNEKRIASITRQNGLSIDDCNAIDIDVDGTIWVATNMGLNKVEGFPNKIKVTVYNSNDGLLSNEIRDVLVVNDTVWSATNDGLNFFNKKDMGAEVEPPLMNVKGFLINGLSLNYDKSLVQLHHTQNDIKIHFSGISFNSGKEITYRYKLRKGSPWNYTRNTMVELLQLPPGDYNFTVAAAGRSGKWSGEEEISFVITKPFWKTNIFIIGVLGAMVGLTWLVTATYFRYRRNVLLQKYQVVTSELKALRAQINPHFLFNAINSIHSLLMKKDWEATRHYLYKFTDLMRSILDHSDSVNITIAEEIKSLQNYLSLESLRMENKFQYNIEVATNLDIHNFEMPAMIIQPFAENAILHGLRYKNEKGCLTIKFAMDETNSLIVTVSDDGIGRQNSLALNKKKKYTSKGVKLITDRIDMLNVQRRKKITLCIENLTTNDIDYPGTCVTIKFPEE